MRIRHVKSVEEGERLVDEFITQGYKVESQGTTTIKVKKVEYGSLLAHLVIFFLTVWWTFGFGNLVYALYKYYSGEEVLIKFEDN